MNNSNIYKVQSVLINKNKINLSNATKWVLEKGYKVKKVDETKNLYRFRQIPPITLEKQGYNIYRNLVISPEITLVLAYKS
jgi:hypothetical protein